MYEDRDNLGIFREQLVVKVKEDDMAQVRPTPTSGSLDVREVLASQFFFS